MATSGIFTLLVNDSPKQDVLLTFTNLLNNRLENIVKAKRAKLPKSQWNTLADLPTLADIEKTHLLFLNSHYQPFVTMAMEYNKVQPIAGNVALGGNATFSIPDFGDFFNDMAVHITLTGLKAVALTDKVKYCDYPGHRILKNVAFNVNGTPLDSYNSSVYTFYRNIALFPGKREGWNRMVGQEEIYTGYITPNPLVDEFRLVQNVSEGAQTLKYKQDDLDLWVPLLFWFCRDIRMSIPSLSIPYGQRNITVDFETVENLMDGVGYSGGDGSFIPSHISQCELYINNIFLTPEIRDIFIKRIGFQLIRVFRNQYNVVNQTSDNICLNNIKWPVESLYFSIQPLANNVGIERLHNWHIGTGVLTKTIKEPVIIPPATLAVQDLIYNTFVDSVDTISLTVQGVPIYKNMPVKFFNSYTQVRYGELLSTSSDAGVFAIHFGAHVGGYQPSGHLNTSRSREFFLGYTSSIIDFTHPAALILTAVCINFLLVSDGSASLRYIT